MKMKLRWKLFLGLLAFCLIPLFVVADISQNGLRRMSRHMADGIQDNLMSVTGQELLQTAVNHQWILIRSKNAAEFAMMFLARSAEYALSRPAPRDPEIYTDHDFDTPARAPRDLTTWPWSSYVPGRPGNLPVRASFGHPVFVTAPGVDFETVRADAERLSTMTMALQQTAGYLQGVIYRVSITLDNGLYLEFPGHGGFNHNTDPRLSPRHTDFNSNESEHFWTDPFTDPITGRVVYAHSMRIFRADGTPAGTASVDVLLDTMIMQHDLAYAWSGSLKTLLASVQDNPETGRPGLLISAAQDYQQRYTPEGARLALKWLYEGDPVAVHQMITSINAGQSGIVSMPYHGEVSLWAFSQQVQQMVFILVVPKSAILEAPVRAGDEVREQIRKQRQVNTLAVLIVLLLAAIAAFLGARIVTRPLRQVIDGMSRLKSGDFTVRLKPGFNDERDLLIKAFNSMAPRIEEHVRIIKALGLAQEVQQNLLPQETPAFPGLDLAGISRYCDQTGGDYYDFFERDGGRVLALVVGDVAGHGISSALLMATARALIRQRAAMDGGPADVVTDVHRQICRDVRQTGQFMTLFYCEFHPDDKSLHFVRAGHDPALLYDPRAKRFQELTAAGPALGLVPGFRFEENAVQVRAGQILLIGTDGVWETLNDQGRMFGKKRVNDPPP